MDDKILELISGEMDEIVTVLCIKHKISPLILSSIVLARLYHLNDAANSTEDFKQLLAEVASGKLGKEDEQVFH